MLFNSLQYILFLPLVVLAYWLVPKRLRLVLLLGASYYFYMSWMRSYGILLAGLTLVNYALGLGIAKVNGSTTNEHIKLKRILLVAGLAINLGTLALYKYTNFIIESIWQLLPHTPIQTGILAGSQAPVLPIILPLGISFFAFEFIHYLTDVYKGGEAIKSPIKFGLFAAFFPSQIAGPIKRYQDFMAQLVEPKPFNSKNFEAGMWLILQGMFKKVALGDNLALLVQSGFSAPAGLDMLNAWVAAIAFALQIYFDFSGYTDIGRGSAQLFGYSLPPNFNLPYLAKNLQDFWHRWHISLSTWLRDYLYIPLGGSRNGPINAMRNLVITMLLGGLWHGASWHYVAWGAFHGFGLVLHRLWQQLMTKLGINSPTVTKLSSSWAYDLTARVFTFMVVCCGWVLFRADNLTNAYTMLGRMFSFQVASLPDLQALFSGNATDTILTQFCQSTLPISLSLYCLLFAGLPYLKSKLAADNTSQDLAFWLQPPAVARVLAYAAVCFVIVGFDSLVSMPFIYFQF
jgi:alginate O-acetyltransferase complex protein AlgI